MENDGRYPPQGDTLSKIAAYFDVSVDYLLGNEQEKEARHQQR